MDRIVNRRRFVADIAVVDWPGALRAQLAAAARSGQAGPADKPWPAQVQLRWLVSGSAGVPPVPFTVWKRRPIDELVPLQVTVSDDVVLWGGTELFALEVVCSPIDPGVPCGVWGYSPGDDQPARAVAVSNIATGPGSHTLTVRASMMTYALLVNATLISARAVAVADVVRAGDWELLEIVGLPYDAGDWAGLIYDGPKQGLVSALTDPSAAAEQRLDRGAPRLGWFPVTGGGHVAPDWQAPDSPSLVKEVRSGLLPRVQELFAPGTLPSTQVLIRTVHKVKGPVQDGREAPAHTSTVDVPVFASLLLATGVDPFVAIGAGFGTGYRLADLVDKEEQPDLMVTATYPTGVDSTGSPVEFAWPLPMPAPHRSMAVATGLTVGRAGLLDPVTRDQPWRETVSMDWQGSAPTSLLFPRVSAVAAARFDPADPAAAVALLEPRDSGGLRPLAPTRRPTPNTDQLRVVDPGRPLPVDGSAVTSGYAVAQADPFGVWSTWVDGSRTITEPNQPIPKLGDASLGAVYAATPQCAAALETTVILDWTARSPAFVQLPISIFPAPWSGAPTPGGVGPFVAVAGGRQLIISVRFDVDGFPESLTPDCSVQWVCEHSDTPVASPAQIDAGDGTRRYKVTLTGLTLDFAAADHYGVAIWARETLSARPDWSVVSPTPTRAFASSPVPVILPPMLLPIVPLGSLPDSAGQSHVTVRVALVGAVRVSIFHTTETQVRQAAGFGSIPVAPPAQFGESLSERFVSLKQAFAALPAAAQRSVFSRLSTFNAGPAAVDVPIPRGSREIHLYLATGITAANVESEWPSSIDRFQVAAAPTLVAPGPVELSAEFVPSAGQTRIGLDLRCWSRLGVAAFEVHRTYAGPITTSAAAMGPPIAVVPANLGADSEGPAGARYVAGWVDPGAGDWRTVFYRAVAVPIDPLADDDLFNGRVAARSRDSAVTSLRMPPTSAPTLALVGTDVFGPATDGVVIRVTTDAPVAPHDLGDFTFRLITDSGAALAVPISAIAVGSTPVALPAVGAGVATRGLRTGGQTEIALWFARPDPHVAVSADMSLTDPLGREIARSVMVPPVPVGAELAILADQPGKPTGTLVDFTMNALAADDWILTVAARPLVPFKVILRETISVSAIPAGVDAPPNSASGLSVTRHQNPDGSTGYRLWVRFTAFHLTLTLTDPLGTAATAQRQVGESPF